MMGQDSKEMRIMYMLAPRNVLIDHNESATIIQVQCYKTDFEKLWAVPQFGRVAFQGHEIFETYEEAAAYQNAVIDSLILRLHTLQSRLNNEIIDLEIENA